MSRKPFLTYTSEDSTDIHFLQLCGQTINTDPIYWNFKEDLWKRSFSTIFREVSVPELNWDDSEPSLYQRPSILMLEDDFKSGLERNKITHPTSILILGKTEFYKLYFCPECGKIQDHLDPNFRYDPNQKSDWHGFTNQEPISCRACGAESFPTVVAVHPNENVPYCSQEDVVAGIDHWLIQQGVESGNTIAGSARQEGRLLNVTWDALVSVGNLWMEIPDEYIFAMAEYCTIYELEKIINLKKGIPVYDGLV